MISEKDMADLAFNGLCSYLSEKLDGLICSLLSHNSNKRLQHKKTEVKKIRIILSILAAMLTMLIVILIVLAMSQMMFTLLNSAGLPRPNLILVTLSSRFMKIDKKKLNLLLM
jgi:LytS/YehU family sensor histidine kinase